MWIEKHGPTWRVRDLVGGRKVTVASGYATKTAAKHAMTAARADQLRGDLVMPADGEITLGEWTRAWWDARKSGLSPTTQRSEWSRIATLILPPLGELQLAQITPLVVQRWVAGQARAAKTVANAHGALHSIMGAAVAERLIRSNPCAGTRLPKGERREMRFLTEPEAGRLLSATPQHHRPLVLTALGTGLRWAELAGLRVRRVDVLGGTLLVEETLQELAGTAELVSVPPKTSASRRTVTLPREVRDALVPLVTRGGEAWVFTSSEGHALRVRNFRRIWKTAVGKAGLDGLRFHDLRHTHASWLISHGVALTAIQRRLGHTSITITSDRYGHLLPIVDERIADVLDAALPRSWGSGGGIERETAGSNREQPERSSRSGHVTGL